MQKGSATTTGMIDIHSHILPALDDGPEDTSTAIAIAAAAVEDGITRMIATPHYLSYGWIPARDAIRSARDSLQAALDERRIDLDLGFAAEVRIVEDLAARVISGEIATLDPGGRYLLIELPRVGNCGDYIGSVIFDLRLSGITPIIAHPEYSEALCADLSLVRQVVEQGALMQVTASSVVDACSRDQPGIVTDMLREGLVHVIATDTHDTQWRPPILSAASQACAATLGERQASLLVETNPARLLAGEDVICLEAAA